MTVLTHTLPAPRLGLPRAARRLRDLARTVITRALAPHKAALANLASIPMTVAAAGCLDAAGFVHSVFAGLIVTAATLVYLEHVIADER